MYKGKDPKKPRRLLLAFTGVSAININGVAIPSGLGINVKSKSYNLSDRQRVVLRNKLAEFRSIDETSMVSSIVFFKVNQWLNEIFGHSGNEPFVGLPVIVCGDLV